VRTLKTSEAATLLNVSPNTLRAWERRFGFPKPTRSPGRHRLYAYGEVAALRDALHDGLSISSAVSVAQEGLSSDTGALAGALAAFEADRADAAMEAAFALRSVERAVEDVLLPALDEVCERHGNESAPWAFAARWGSEWLRRAQRFTPPPVRRAAVLIGDAARDELDPDTPYIRALELLTARTGARVLGLSVRGAGALAEGLSRLGPDVVVLAGSHASDDEVARWAYAVRAAAGPLPVAVFRRPGQTRLRGPGNGALPARPAAASQEIMELIEARQLESVPIARPSRLAAGRRVGSA
jgi:MerR family transcriptional regulator, light-induced transcriptional regulator